MHVSVMNNTDFSIDTLCYKRFLKVALYVAGIEGDVNLIFIDDDYMKKLNRQFRAKDKTTDVLTFADSGDIAISYQWVLNHYKEDKIKKVVIKLIVHSILHLMGIHHDYTDSSLKENYRKMNILYKDIINYKKTKILKRSILS